MSVSQANFVWGIVGGIAPEILRLYKLATTGHSLGEFGVSYFVITAFYLAVAGAFAIAWKSDNPLKSIWVGASVPVAISAFAASPPPAP